MKKLIALSALVFATSCRFSDAVAPTITNSNNGLGVPSSIMAVVATTTPSTSGPYSITVNVTPGATYSFQLTHINGTILNNKGFTATAAQMTVTMDYSAVPNGAYDLNLMDNTGRALVVPVIVQH